MLKYESVDAGHGWLLFDSVVKVLKRTELEHEKIRHVGVWEYRASEKLRGFNVREG